MRNRPRPTLGLRMGYHKVDVSRTSALLANEQQKVGPECLLCLKPIEKAEFVNEPGHEPVARFRLRCHGQDETVGIEMGTAQWTFAEAGKLLNRARYFDPHQLASVTESR
ncbi:MAG: hypothetical protein KGL39_56345 [Patescibacteria group bacterium]|nr:hypothetical protein [Patescibacteria group bacterium]